MADSRCRMPDARYLMPDARYLMPDAGIDVMSKTSSINYTDLEPDSADEELMLHEGSAPLSYRDLKVWQMARELSIAIHRLTLEKLPRFEIHEEGSQIRRSSKSVRSNIVEGFGRRRYKLDFIKHLTYAEASCDETVDHLETLFETGSLTDQVLYDSLHPRLCELGKRLNRFVAAVERQHESPK